jgi:hypothetical protein
MVRNDAGTSDVPHAGEPHGSPSSPPHLGGISFSREIVATANGWKIVVLDTVSAILDEDRGQVVVTGSHGGTSAGEYALRADVAVVVCNDAGFGKNHAGVAGLKALAGSSIPALAVAGATARIGDGSDMWNHGVVSYVNDAADHLGFTIGLPLRAQLIGFINRQARDGTVAAPGLPHIAGDRA